MRSTSDIHVIETRISERSCFESAFIYSKMSSLLSAILLCVVLSTVAVAGRRRDAHVNGQLDHAGEWVRADAPLVSLEVYYETLCPYSRAFINTQLYPTAQLVGSIFNISFIPYGNAQEVWLPQKNEWAFTCQHGPKECTANLIQTCAISLCSPGKTRRLSSVCNSSNLLNYIYCMEKSDDPSVAGQPCASQSGIEWDLINYCTSPDINFGNQLEHVMALKTDALNPPHTQVPWIVVNGVHTDTIQAEATADLIQLICDTYTGTRPKACPP